MNANCKFPYASLNYQVRADATFRLESPNR
jgi:hypothetical protein